MDGVTRVGGLRNNFKRRINNESYRKIKETSGKSIQLKPKISLFHALVFIAHHRGEKKLLTGAVVALHMGPCDFSSGIGET